MFPVADLSVPSLRVRTYYDHAMGSQCGTHDLILQLTSPPL